MFFSKILTIYTVRNFSFTSAAPSLTDFPSSRDIPVKIHAELSIIELVYLRSITVKGYTFRGSNAASFISTFLYSGVNPESKEFAPLGA